MIREAKRRDMVCLPGVATPTEAFARSSAGADGLKLFPAEAMVPAVLAPWRAVLPKAHARVRRRRHSPRQHGAMVGQGAAGFGTGSNLYKPGADPADVRAAAAAYAAAVSCAAPALIHGDASMNPAEAAQTPRRIAPRFDIVALGEAMIEFNQTRGGDARAWLQGFGGDTSNMRRSRRRGSAHAQGYVTRVGNDEFGRLLIDLWNGEAVSTEGVGDRRRRADRRVFRLARRERPRVLVSSLGLGGVANVAFIAAARRALRATRVLHLSGDQPGHFGDRVRCVLRRDRRRAQRRSARSRTTRTCASSYGRLRVRAR